MRNKRNKSRFALASLAAFVILIFAFHPASAAGLRSPFEKAVERAVASYSFPKAARSETPLRALGGITPHHDLALAMIVRFYERVSSPEVKRVWLFSPDHFRRARRLVAVCDADWKLDTGTLASDKDACAALDSLSFAENDAPMFRREHGITIHIPFIARYFPNARVVPIVLDRNIPDMGLIILRKKIMEMAGPDDVIILSMDLSHYKTPEAMAEEDVRTLEVLRAMKPLETWTLDVDARRAAALVLYLFKNMGASVGEVLERADSSAVLGRHIESGTSYATVIYSKDVQ
ncbi:MAG: AmmeMemoRadiSam system protein B [Synergistaceae bacterium]|nr:AmmeMemoRadiSam system protein B [Synergistaceae bacterium]